MSPKCHRIPIDGEWDLVDLSTFPQLYRQLYSVVYSFEVEIPAIKEEIVNESFIRHPWKGGFSTINWFNDLYYAIPSKDRPKIKSIQYASPGWIDLDVLVTAAASLQVMVVAVLFAVRQGNKTYSQIQNGIQERRLNEIKLQRRKLILDRERLQFVTESCEKLAQLMGFKHLKEMHKRTGNALVSLKMLLAMYRRLRELSEFEVGGKTKMTKRKAIKRDDTEG